MAADADDTGETVGAEAKVDPGGGERFAGEGAMPEIRMAVGAMDDAAVSLRKKGGIVVPELGPAVDPYAAFVRLLGLVARTQLTLSQIDGRIPQAHVLRRDVPTPWAHKGQVMRAVIESAGDRTVDTVDGVRVVELDPELATAATRARAGRPSTSRTTPETPPFAEVVGFGVAPC